MPNKDKKLDKLNNSLGKRTAKIIIENEEKRKTEGAKILTDEVHTHGKGVRLSVYSHKANDKQSAAFFWNEVTENDIVIANNLTLEATIEAALKSTFEKMVNSGCAFTVAACFKESKNNSSTVITASNEKSFSAYSFTPESLSSTASAGEAITLVGIQINKTEYKIGKNTLSNKTDLQLINLSHEEYSELKDTEKRGMFSPSFANAFGGIKNKRTPGANTTFSRISNLEKLEAGKLVFLITASSLLPKNKVKKATDGFNTTFRTALTTTLNNTVSATTSKKAPGEEKQSYSAQPDEQAKLSSDKHIEPEKLLKEAALPSAQTPDSPKPSEPPQVVNESKEEGQANSPTANGQPQIVIESKEEKKPEQPPIKETEVVTESKEARQSNSPKPSGQPVIKSGEKQTEHPNTIVSFRKSLIDCINAAFENYTNTNNLEKNNCSEMFYFFKKHSYTAGNKRRNYLVEKIESCTDLRKISGILADFFAHKGGNWEASSFKPLLKEGLIKAFVDEKQKEKTKTEPYNSICHLVGEHINTILPSASQTKPLSTTPLFQCR